MYDTHCHSAEDMGLIEMIPAPVDYIQFFRLQGGDGVQAIIHEQEEPVYSKTVSFPCAQPVAAKIYVIDSIDSSIIELLPEIGYDVWEIEEPLYDPDGLQMIIDEAREFASVETEK